MSNSITRWSTSVCAYLLAAVVGSTAAAAEGGWQFGGSIYGWFPDISGRTALADATGGGEFEIDIEDILSNLEFTFQGGLDVRNGRWGVATDVIYMSVGNSESNYREGTLGGTQIPTDASASVEFDMKSWIWTTAGYYRALDDARASLDVLVGFRYLDIEQTLDWSLTGNVADIPVIDRAGSGVADVSNWDAIVGLRGRFKFGAGDAWFVPYYADLGAGDSKLTYQLAAGVGYAFGWGELTGVWRLISYESKSGAAVEDMEFSGPAVGATFRW